MPSEASYEGFLFGNRIPKNYVITKGFGDTNIGFGTDPWEAGSFDMATDMAGVRDFNIVRYTSILPPEAREISLTKAKAFYHPGAVMECIIAQKNGIKGEHICAGVGTIQVTRLCDKSIIANYASEYVGNGDEEEAKNALHVYLMQEFARRYDPSLYSADNESFCIQEHTIRYQYGTVIALIGFVTYIYPIIKTI